LAGLGILLRRGMASWMNACATVVASAESPPLMVSDSAQLPSNVQRDVINVLAAMTFSRSEDGPWT
jgi:hypothetical protein